MFLATLSMVWRWVKSGDYPAHSPYNGPVKNYLKRDKSSTNHARDIKHHLWNGMTLWEPRSKLGSGRGTAQFKVKTDILGSA